MSKFYIAYGSNLSVGHMAVRCPDAKVAGMAALDGWKLTFKLHADIEPCKGRTVPVLVWEISEADERSLDFYEGYPSYYIKKDFAITMTDLEGRHPKEVTAMAYVMAEGRMQRTPMEDYYQILWDGYERFGFNTYQLELALKEAQEAQHEFSR